MEEEEEKNRKAARKLRFSVKIRGEIVNQNDDGNNGRDNERTIEILYRCVLIGTHRHRAERAERNRCSSSSFVECSSRYSKRGRFCVTFSRKRSMRHFGPSIGQTTGGKFLFFFLFCLLLLPPSFFLFFFFFFLASLDSLQALESVLASNSWLECLEERRSVYLLSVRYVVRLVNSVSILDRVPKNLPRGPSSPQ